MAKRTKKQSMEKVKKRTSTENTNNPSNNRKIVWVFDRIDRSGPFAFDINRDDFDHKEILDKMISYSSMTWNEVNRQTHDRGRSKHHFLDAEGFSKEAQERINYLELNTETDSIFSFALQNRLRVIGLRNEEKFHVLWYDPQHAVYPARMRHT